MQNNSRPEPHSILTRKEHHERYRPPTSHVPSTDYGRRQQQPAKETQHILNRFSSPLPQAAMQASQTPENDDHSNNPRSRNMTIDGIPPQLTASVEKYHNSTDMSTPINEMDCVVNDVVNERIATSLDLDSNDLNQEENSHIIPSKFRAPSSRQSETSEKENSSGSSKQCESNTTAPTAILEPTDLPSDVEIITEMCWSDSEPWSGGPKLAHRPKKELTEPCNCLPYENIACCVNMSCVLCACQEECPLECPAGRNCGNQRIQRQQWKDTQVFDAGKKGRGMRAMECIGKGEFIVEYVGIAVQKKHLEALFREYTNERMLYIMSLDKNTYIDARKKGGIARFINHSCDPNCVVHCWKVNGINRAAVFALKSIRVGEELGFDYQWERRRGRPITKCHCMTPNCRGFLEMPRESTPEEKDMELLFQGHWKDGPSSGIDGEGLVNRKIKVFFQGNQEFYVADVLKFDVKTGNHLVAYKSDEEENWEDLSKEQWLILDEEAEHHVIGRKERSPVLGDNKTQAVKQLHGLKNSLVVSSEIKKILTEKRIIKNCQNFHRVQISTMICSGNELQQGENPTKFGTWKLTVEGMKVEEAMQFLEKNVAEIKSLQIDPCVQGNKAYSSITILSEEVILPRKIVDMVKKKLFILRHRCHNVSLMFIPSESKSKRFAKIVLASECVSDMENAQMIIWNELMEFCRVKNITLSSIGIPKDLGFLGGSIKYNKARALFCSNNQDSLEHIMEDEKKSDFLKTFEDAHKCCVWVQPEADVLKMDPYNRTLNLASSTDDAKIYLGCLPTNKDKCWNLILGRVKDLENGVVFFSLIEHRIYQPQIITEVFLNFAQKTSGAKITLDNATEIQLRIDGMNGNSNDSQPIMPDDDIGKKVKRAEDLIRMQLQLLRDHHLRQQRWCFGRNWNVTKDSRTSSHSSEQQSSCEPRIVSNSCAEISEITSSLSLDKAIAAHAIVILYRFTRQITQLDRSSTLKSREITLACLFLAIKSQKIVKWKRLEVLLEAAYSIFYPGATISLQSEEARRWEKKILCTENEILSALKYDIFWAGIDYVFNSAVRAGVKPPLASNVLDLALSTPVLAAGPVLWLDYGFEYAFAASAGLISVDLSKLFSVISLDTKKLAHSAELIVESRENLSQSKKLTSKNALNAKKHQHLRDVIMNRKNLEDVQTACNKEAEKFIHQAENLVTVDFAAVNVQRIVQQSNRSVRFSGLQPEFVHHFILPILNKIHIESKCNVFFGNVQGGSNTENIVLEGSWRGIAIAEKTLKDAFSKYLSTLVPVRQRTPPNNPEMIQSNTRDSPPVKKKQGGPRSSKLNSWGSNGTSGWNSKSNGWSSVKKGWGEEQVHSKNVTISNNDQGWSQSKNGLKSCGSSCPSDVSLSPSSFSRSRQPSRPEVLDTQKMPEGDDLDPVRWIPTFEGKCDPGTLKTSCITNAKISVVSNSNKELIIGGKGFFLAKIPEHVIIEAGLRWSIPARYGSCHSASICDTLIIRLSDSTDVQARQKAVSVLQHFLAGIPNSHNAAATPSYERQPTPSIASEEEDEAETFNGECRFREMSLQRWPAEKVELRERSKSAVPGEGRRMDMGFSVAALQEMQLLYQLHQQIPLPQGHPNFVLPIAVAIGSSKSKEATTSKPSGMILDFNSSGLGLSPHSKSRQDKDIEEETDPSSSYLIFDPTPVILHTVLNRFKRRFSNKDKHLNNDRLAPSILVSWFHDLLSALEHCHSNHIVLRTLNTDQIVIDHSGVVKFSGLSRTIVIPAEERATTQDPLSNALRSKRMGVSSDNADGLINHYMAPELLLGATRYTKDTDIWSLGCLVAHILLNKPLFAEKNKSNHTTAIFKIVGTPTKDNYEDAKQFPNYEDSKPNNDKQYKRDVKGAILYMLRRQGMAEDETVNKYSGVIQLLGLMLDLDPKRRITATEALDHECMKGFVEKTKSSKFCRKFASDWADVKRKVIYGCPLDNNPSGKRQRECSLGSQRDEKRAYTRNSEKSIKAVKRLGDDEDELYRDV